MKKTVQALAAAAPLWAVAATPLPIDLPEGMIAEVAAAPPLVRHPIMAALGERGRLFVGDAAGLNLNKAGLEKELPNRVLLLTDLDGDGTYDESSVFADLMTFPQGGVWLGGSLYVASPPCIWKLTDHDRDGVAEQREMIVGGFDYTGNAADVHGPFLHPNGRLYWCHGRKGHEVKQKDGTLVHAGLASGIWSCEPDGADVRWHALGSGDNPVEIDFTPEGEIVGTENIFFTNPRGDTINHWLRGGVYPRADQLKAIAGLPRTLDVMPVVHNLGHVGVAGCAFYRSGVLDPDWRGNLFVAHFNTQRVTRMELTSDGATYKAFEREFLKLRHPDAHLTDVLEDRDGSLLVVDTGGWFRIGCPASLLAKPDVAGAVYRIRKIGAAPPAEPWGGRWLARVWELCREGGAGSVRELTALLAGEDARVAHAAGNALAVLAAPEAAPALVAALGHRDPGVQLGAAHALGALPQLDEEAVGALLRRIEGDVDAAVEHQAMDALIRANQPAPLLTALRAGRTPALQRRALAVFDQLPGSPIAAAHVLPLLDSTDGALARKAADVLARHADWVPAATAHFAGWLKAGAPPERLALLELAVQPWLSEEPVRSLVTALIESPDTARQRTAWSLIASPGTGAPDPRWAAPLQAALGEAPPADLPLVLEAIAKAGGDTASRDALRLFANDEHRPLGLRLKALDAALKAGAPLPADAFALLRRVFDGDLPAASARLAATRVVAKAKLDKDQSRRVASTFATLSPLELREFLKVVRQSKEAETGKLFAAALKAAPALGALQESEVRTALSGYPPEVFAIVAPALRDAAAEDDARRRKLETWPARAIASGRPAEGRRIFESGKGACTVCHRVGEVGNLVGPNLSTIGQIRSERDLLESILFPDATLARDYEAHAIETAEGQSFIGVVRRNLPEAIVVADAAGQEHTLQRARIISMQALPTSLMPAGLDRALTEEELLDLVAFLRSRK